MLTKVRLLYAAVILVAILLALLVPESAGGSEDFPFASPVSIISPSNSTYSTGQLTLNVRIVTLIGRNINVSIAYTLDGTCGGEIPLAKLPRNGSKISALYMGSAKLPELPDGPHRLDVHCRIEIENFSANGVYHQKYVCWRNATVHFTINTAPLTAPNQQPENQQPKPSINPLIAIAITVAGAALLAYYKKLKIS